MRLIAVFLLITAPIGAAFAESNPGMLGDFSSWMEIAYSGDYQSCKMVVDNLYALAVKKKIWGNDNQTMDVLQYMGQLGSSIGVNPTSRSQDFGYIRMKSVQALAVIGGDYARSCVIRICNSEKNAVNPEVLTACLEALKKMGNDKSFSALKSVMSIFSVMPKVEMAGGKETLFAFISCMEKLAKNAPKELIVEYGVIETLRELGNENSRYWIYSQEVRKSAQTALMNLQKSTNVPKTSSSQKSLDLLK